MGRSNSGDLPSLKKRVAIIAECQQPGIRQTDRQPPDGKETIEVEEALPVTKGGEKSGSSGGLGRWRQA
jgi:hypothetical protein